MSEVQSASVGTWDYAFELLLRGKLIVFPTDTVYGLGCNPLDPAALEAVFQAKGRPEQKALPLLLSGLDQVSKVSAGLSGLARQLGTRFWPGALTLIVPKSPTLPAELGNNDTIAIRIPAHAGLLSYIHMCGGAIAATSANLSGMPDPVDVAQAVSFLGDSVALYIDGGRTPGSLPSTVVDCTGSAPRILREGAIPADVITRTLAEGGF